MVSSQKQQGIYSVAAMSAKKRAGIKGDADSSEKNLSSTAHLLRQELLDMIQRGEISSGVRLDQRQLAKRLKTTTAPLREAFSALENEGLLVRQPGLGVFCKIYTVLEIEELVEIRGVLESLAARRATRFITDEEIAELTEVAKELAVPIVAGEESAFIYKHIEFHKRIVKISRSPRLQELLQYHHFIDTVLANIASSLWKIEAHDHLGIVDALASRNPEWAEQSMRNHIAPTYQKRFAALRTRYGEGPIITSPNY